MLSTLYVISVSLVVKATTAFLPLDFDPLDVPIEIQADDGTVLFSGMLTL